MVVGIAGNSMGVFWGGWFVVFFFTCVRTPDWICSGCAAGACGTIGTAFSILTGNPECFVVAWSPAVEDKNTSPLSCFIIPPPPAFFFLVFCLFLSFFLSKIKFLPGKGRKQGQMKTKKSCSFWQKHTNKTPAEVNNSAVPVCQRATMDNQSWKAWLCWSP